MRKLRKQQPSSYRVFHHSQSITPKSGKLLAQHFLLGPLNANPESPVSRRILKVLELAQRAQQFHKELDREARRTATSEGVLVTHSIRRLGLGSQKALRQLGKLANRHRWRFKFFMLPGGGEILRTDIPLTRNTGDAREASALLLLTQFHDFAERIRRCDECARWFFAATYHQTYCSGACRQKHASYSAEFKAKRAEYMRGYRPRKKFLEQKAKQRRIKELKQRVTTARQKIALLKGRQHDGGF